MLNLRFVLTIGVMILGGGVVLGQEYPNRPIRILVGPHGSGGDFTARVIAEGISGPLGQPVVVDNRGSGVITSEILSKASSDGYTLRISGGATWIFPLLQKAPYDAVRDLSPISMISREVLIFAVHPSVPVKSVKEFIALAKAKPGTLNYASVAVGSSQHLGTELFKSMANVNIVHVPFKGSAAALTGLIGGEAQLLISDLGLATPHMKSGKIRALAVTSATPSALAPGLPPVASDLPSFEVVGVTGIWAPARTPAAVVNRLNQEIVRVLRPPNVRERFLSRGAEIVAGSPEQFASFIKTDIAIMGKVIKDADIKID